MRGCKYSFILHFRRLCRCLCSCSRGSSSSHILLTTGPARVGNRPRMQPAVFCGTNDERCLSDELFGKLVAGGQVRRDCRQRPGVAANARRDVFRAVGRPWAASGSRRPHAGRHLPHHRVSARSSRATGVSGLLDPKRVCYQDRRRCRKRAPQIPSRILAVHGPLTCTPARWASAVSGRHAACKLILLSAGSSFGRPLRPVMCGTEARSTMRLEPGQIEVIDDELAAVLQRDADGRAFGDRRPAVLLRTANDRRYAACRASGLGRTARWPRGRATNPDGIG